MTAARLATTTAQYGIWVAQRVDDDATGYWTAECIDLEGPLQVPLLQRAIEHVLNQCPALHMRFEWDGQTLWQHPQPPVLQAALCDFTGEADPDDAARQWMLGRLETPCDVSTHPLCLSAVLRTGPERHTWYLQIHHVAMDGFGYSLLQQAVATHYNALRAGTEPPSLPRWALQPVIEAEHRYRDTGAQAADRQFWRGHLSQVPGGARLAAPQEAPSARPRRCALRFAPAEVAAVQAAARAAGADWATWLLAAIGLWLGRQSGQRDLCFGLPAMNRLGTPALGVPCMAMNIVPFTVHLRDDASMRTLAADAARELRTIKPHLYYRYGWIRGDLGLLQSGKFLFNQAVNLMPFDRRVPFAAVASRPRAVSGGPVKDLNLTLTVDQGEWQLLLEAHPDAYDAQQVASLADDLQRQLAALARQPADTPLSGWLKDLPPTSVCDGAVLDAVEGASPEPVLLRLQRVADAQPNHVAIENADERLTQPAPAPLTYAALLSRVRVLAAQLAQRGVTPQATVAVLLPRSSDAVVAALAVLWVGATYAPLDIDGPPERSAAWLAAMRPQLLLANADTAPVEVPVLRLDTPFEREAPPVPCHAPAIDHPAYLLSTSGSTGQPKGVRIGHGALAQFVVSTAPLFGIGPHDRVLQFAPLHFDASLEEIFATLCGGATLVLRDAAMLDSAQAFAAAVERLGITVLDLPTAYWHALTHALDAEAAHRLRDVRLAVIGGEAALPERVARWRALLPGPVLLNTYGPTETTIIVSSAVLSGPGGPTGRGAGAEGASAAQVPIGRPRPGVQLRVVDERLYALPAGRAGELVVCGPALALDYLDDPERTAQAFVTLPDSGTRAYRTGDRARWVDGVLYFEGRLDRELKIAGLRVDPLEIENLLLAEPAVQEAAVLPVGGDGGLLSLAAFVVGTDDVTALCRALQRRLPAAAVPDRWHTLTALPRTSSGKIDRRALAAQCAPSAGAAAGGGGGFGVGAREGLEAIVMQAWHEVLGPQALHAGSDFFALGGKSLQAIQLSSRLAHALQREVPVSLLFRHATVQAQARALAMPAAYRAPAAQEPFAPCLQIQPGAPVLFCLHPSEGLAWSYLRLAPHLPGIGLVGLQMVTTPAADAAAGATTDGATSGLAANAFDALVDQALERVREQQPHGPYHLLGWSLGGALAHALAARLAAAGEAVGLVALMDSYPAPAWRRHPAPRLVDTLRTLLTVNGEFDTAGHDEGALRARLLRAGSPFAELGEAGLADWAWGCWRQTQAFRASEPCRYDGPVVLYQALRNPPDRPRPDSWQGCVGQLDVVGIDVAHEGLSDPQPMARIGADLAARLAARGTVRGAP